jgi:osmotically-inducible protein OsmY
MKTDLQLKSDVTAELLWDGGINPARVGVAVRDGIVTLSGEVDTYLQKHTAEAAVRRVGGVRGIALDLEVRLAPPHERSDAEIAHAAVMALRWHALVPEDRIQVAVEDGWVTLTGEVERNFQSASAEQCIRPLLGVKGVSNRIVLTHRANPQEIRAGIEAALARHAQREARHIQVEVDGSVVTVRGEVGSLAEQEAVLGTAGHAKGVTRVVDELAVFS